MAAAQAIHNPPNGADETLPAESAETPADVVLENPLSETVSIPVLIGRTIRAVLGIVGSLALAMFVYGGFLWMTAAGNTERIQTGKNTLVWAAIGLVVIFSSYVAVRLVILTLTRSG